MFSSKLHAFLLALVVIIGRSEAAFAQFTQPRFGQFQVMRYKTAEDSINMLNVQAAIDELIMKKPLQQKKLDSLMNVQQAISSRVIFKTVFRPSRDFLLTDSLSQFDEYGEIYRVSVFEKSAIPDVVYKCKDLVSLELVNTSIDALPERLNELKNLKVIYIYNNKSKGRLKLIRSKTITDFVMRTEDPKTIPTSFKSLTALERLDLSENHIKKFPNGARHNKKLKEFSLQRNELRLNKKIKKHKYLERLALQGNQIEHVPASIKNLPSLKKLNFNNNRVVSVHPSIGKLIKLENISFYNNQLTAIPEGIYKLKNLLEIDLFHNQIEEIKPEFANWQKLTTLYVSHNKLTALPDNLDTLKFLSGLYAWDNRIGQFPKSIGSMTELRFIRMNHNYLKEFPVEMSNLKQLEELDISHNYITEVPEEIFDYPNLKILAMVNNPWNEKTWKFIPKKTEELRKKDVYVHISAEDEN